MGTKTKSENILVPNKLVILKPLIIKIAFPHVHEIVSRLTKKTF